ncbi:MAG: response regulator [Planctomycetota bacterium]
MKVLLVDDSGVMRKIIARGLNSLWVDEVVEAADGVEALEVFGDGSDIDLVLTDWNMPNMNGLELIKSIRGAGHKVPIMMITTESEKSQVLTAIQAGVNDYLVKPFDQEMLTMKLERVLPNPQTS